MPDLPTTMALARAHQLSATGNLIGAQTVLARQLEATEPGRADLRKLIEATRTQLERDHDTLS